MGRLTSAAEGSSSAASQKIRLLGAMRQHEQSVCEGTAATIKQLQPLLQQQLLPRLQQQQHLLLLQRCVSHACGVLTGAQCPCPSTAAISAVAAAALGGRVAAAAAAAVCSAVAGAAVSASGAVACGKPLLLHFLGPIPLEVAYGVFHLLIDNPRK